MPLDRQSIEKKDFPIGRRGYEPDAVDDHLARLAGEIEALQRDPGERPSAPSMAVAASEQVRSIVQAAETSAADIERAAGDEGERIRAEAAADAERSRADATDKAREHVGKVSEATALMLQRVDAMETELGGLVEALRTGANRLTADLSLLEGNLGDLHQAAGSQDRAERDPAPVSAPRAPVASLADASLADELESASLSPTSPDAADIPDVRAGQTSFDAGPEPESPARAAGLRDSGAVSPEVARTDDPGAARAPSSAPAAAPAANGAADADVEGARLVALNMALNGQSRDETDRYLAENFDLSDRTALLDEVYASVDG